MLLCRNFTMSCNVIPEQVQFVSTAKMKMTDVSRYCDNNLTRYVVVVRMQTNLEMFLTNC